MTRRQTLLVGALLLALVKCVEFAVDSQALFFHDSGAFFLNGLRLAFVSFRSWVYGYLICAIALPFHSLRAIVALQMFLGGLTAWLLTLALVRFMGVRPWIGILAGLAFAIDPVQVLYEHMVMTEATAVAAMAAFLVVALEYQRRPHGSVRTWMPWLAILSLLGIVLVSLRTVYLPVVLAAAVLLPVCVLFPSSGRRRRLLALALAVSCGSTLLFHVGYRRMTGHLARREPGYNYWSGFFLLATVTPIIKPGDSDDPRVADAVAAQSRSAVPLLIGTRTDHLWNPGGLVPRLIGVFGGDERQADLAAQRVARAAIRRNPRGFIGLGLNTWLAYWKGIPTLRWSQEWENGVQPPHVVNANDARVILSSFGADVSNQGVWITFSRRYEMRGRYWYVFLLLAPFLSGVAWWLAPGNPEGPALLFVWSCLLLAATCLGASDSPYRYLHPFSFTGLAGVAILCEKAFGKRTSRSVSAAREGIEA
jgi:hypothetical protein